MTGASLPPLVITGASGFIGQRLLALLATRAATQVVCLSREPSRLTGRPTWRPGWRAVQVDLEISTSDALEMSRDAVVLHLAAPGRSASPAAMRALQVDGTQRLLEAARGASARHFILVSSIAAAFRDQRWYHYAHTKLAAEGLVRASGLPFTIVRPSMVLGPGSAIQEALTGIAIGRAPIVPGTGEVLTQPVFVDDVAQLLAALATSAPHGGVVEAGGPERLTMRALLDRIRVARGLESRTLIPVPLGVARWVLGAIEPIVRPLLPVTAGQLATFVNDSVAEPGDLVRRFLPSPRPLDAMLLETAAA